MNATEQIEGQSVISQNIASESENDAQVESMDKQWFLLMAKPNQDERAETNLQRQDFEVYRPMARVPKKRRGKRIFVVESLFPRYMFIHMSRLADNWSPIRSTYGVSQLVRFGALPPAVPDALIHYLRDSEGAFEQRAISLADFKKDDKVKIVDGALRGCEGIFQCYDGKERAALLIKILGRQKQVVVPAAALVGAQ